MTEPNKPSNSGHEQSVPIGQRRTIYRPDGTRTGKPATKHEFGRIGDVTVTRDQDFVARDESVTIHVPGTVVATKDNELRINGEVVKDEKLLKQVRDAVHDVVKDGRFSVSEAEGIKSLVTSLPAVQKQNEGKGK